MAFDTQVKSFFRTVIKIVPGGPAVGTPGSNRSEGMLAALDKIIEFIGPRTDITDVPAPKREAVANAIIAQVDGGGQAMLIEPDLTYAERYFKDNRDPEAPAVYRCEKESNPTTGATEYWWNRYAIQ